MKNFFVYVLLFSLFLGGGWYYAPVSFREKAAAFVGFAIRHDTGEIKNFVENIAFPKDPEKRREILISELEKNITEFKRRGGSLAAKNQEKKSVLGQKTDIQNKSGAELIASSEKLIEELKQTSQNRSPSERIIERIMNTILPEKPEIKQGNAVCEK